MSSVLRPIAVLIGGIITVYSILLLLMAFACAQDEFLRVDNVFFSVILFDLFNIFVILIFLDLITFLVFRKSLIIRSPYLPLYLALPIFQAIILFISNIDRTGFWGIALFGWGFTMSLLVIAKSYFKDSENQKIITRIPAKIYFLYIVIPTFIIYKTLRFFYG